MVEVKFENAAKEFPNATRAVDDFTLTVPDREFVVFVGPSGSGKSTALRLVAGLETLTTGAIYIGGVRVNDVEPRHRDIAMVFQDYALYPHMTVEKNLSFGLRLRKYDRAKRDARVREVAEMLGIADLLQRQPRQLSGGQRQRVAMGRAIVREPSVLLMDEPLSNLDAKLRVHMRGEIARLHREIGTTTIYVTHDQVEAMTMADRVAILRDGRLEQAGTPEELYEDPANVFVAGFMGSPAMNFVSSTLDGENGTLRVHLGSATVSLETVEPRRREALCAYVGRNLVVGLRPEDLQDANAPAATGSLDAAVQAVEYLGSEAVVHCGIDAAPFESKDVLDLARDIDVDVELVLRTEEAVIVARVSRDKRPRIGDRIRLHIDPRRLYFFDPETEAAII